MKRFMNLMLLLPMLCGCNSGSGEEEVPYLKTLDWDQLAPSVQAEGKIRLTDRVGRQVDVIPGSFNRVLCVGAGALRLYSYIGDINKICAVEDIDNTALSARPKMFDGVARPYFVAHENALKGLPSCGVGGPNAQAPEYEKIVACQPDLIISEYEDAALADSISQRANAPVLTLDYGEGNVLNKEVYGSLLMLGKALDKEQKAKELIAYCNDSVKTIWDTTKAAKTKKKAYVAGLGIWGTANAYSTSPSYEAFVYAHIDNVVKDRPKTGVQTIDREYFLSIAPSMDLMFFDAASVKNIVGQGIDFSTCAAFGTGEVYLQMAYNAYYTNVETGLVNCWFVAKSAYPELFTHVEIAAKADEIFQKFLGKTLYEEVKGYKNSFGGYQKIASPSEFFK